MKLPPVIAPPASGPSEVDVMVKLPKSVNWALVSGSLKEAPAANCPPPITPPSGRMNSWEPVDPLELVDALEPLDPLCPLDPFEPLDPLEELSAEPEVELARPVLPSDPVLVEPLPLVLLAAAAVEPEVEASFDVAAREEPLELVRPLVLSEPPEALLALDDRPEPDEMPNPEEPEEVASDPVLCEPPVEIAPDELGPGDPLELADTPEDGPAWPDTSQTPPEQRLPGAQSESEAQENVSPWTSTPGRVHAAKSRRSSPARLTVGPQRGRRHSWWAPRSPRSHPRQSRSHLPRRSTAPRPRQRLPRRPQRARWPRSHR